MEPIKSTIKRTRLNVSEEFLKLESNGMLNSEVVSNILDLEKQMSVLMDEIVDRPVDMLQNATDDETFTELIESAESFMGANLATTEALEQERNETYNFFGNVFLDIAEKFSKLGLATKKGLFYTHARYINAYMKENVRQTAKELTDIMIPFYSGQGKPTEYTFINTVDKTPMKVMFGDNDDTYFMFSIHSVNATTLGIMSVGLLTDPTLKLLFNNAANNASHVIDTEFMPLVEKYIAKYPAYKDGLENFVKVHAKKIGELAIKK